MPTAKASVSQPLGGCVSLDNKIDVKALACRGKFHFLAENVDNFNFFGEHLWSPEQFLETIGLSGMAPSLYKFPCRIL